MHQIFVDVDIHCSWNERMRKGKTDPTVKRSSLSLETLPKISRSAYIHFMLAPLEAGRYRVDWIENDIRKPTEQSGNQTS